MEENTTNENKTVYGRVAIERVNNGYLITTGNGSKYVASNESGALGAISALFKGTLPASNGSVTEVAVTVAYKA